MIPLLIAAGVSAASSLLGASAQASAAKEAAAKSAAAAQQSQVLLKGNYDNISGMYAPSVQLGQDVLGQLGSTYGVGSAGTPDWDAYVAQNPDVAAIQAIVNGQAQGTPDQLNFINDWQRSGMSLGEYHHSVVPDRAVPTTGGSGPSAYQDPTAPQGYTAAPYQAPAPYVAPTRPTMAPLDVSLGTYEQSPDYLYQLSEGSKNLNANYGAKGLLQSGAAMKALQQFGQDTALGDYTQFRDYKTSQYNTDANRSDSNYNFDANFGLQAYDDARNFGRSTYESDRNYGASRYDQSQNRLFQLADIGTNAMGQVANAGNNYATSSSNILTGNAQTQGQAGIASANAWSNGINGAAGAVSRGILGTGAGGGSSYGTSQMYGDPLYQLAGQTMAVPATPARSAYTGGYR